jgi:hypothetical protein
MSPHDRSLDGVFASARSQNVEQICGRFENAWQLGQSPRLEAFLDEAPAAERDSLLPALLEVELSYRDAKGQSPSPEEYRARFPDHADRIAAVFQRAAPFLIESSRDVSLSDTKGLPDGGPTRPQAAAETVPPRIGRYLRWRTSCISFAPARGCAAVG